MKVTEFLNSALQTLSPIGNFSEIFPTAVRPVIEWVGNKKYYSGTAIENETDKGVAPYLRYGPYTSETAKAVGHALGSFNSQRGVSPKKIENALYGLTGGVGRMTMGLVDWLAGKAGVLPENPKAKEPFSGTPLRPIVQGLLSQRASGFESEPARVFYAAAEAVSETEKTLASITGRVLGKTDEEKQEWIHAHPDDMKEINQELKAWITSHPNEMELLKISRTPNKSGNPSNIFVKGRAELSSLRKAENKIASDTTLSSVEKRKALDLIDKKVSEIVDPTWHLINAVSSRKKTSPGQRGK
jgi:hypothetical protein